MSYCPDCKQELRLGGPVHTCPERIEREAKERLALTACSPCEPLRRAYSREEMRDASVKWMIEQYGRPIEMDSEEKDRWHERCGMLYHFIYDHFPAENRDVLPSEPKARIGSNAEISPEEDGKDQL